MSTAGLDRRLHEKYDAALPRYTSYPTAPHFSADCGEDAYRDWVVRSNGDPLPRPLSLYVHIPFCASLCYYCACNKIITQHPEKADQYLGYLERELAMRGPMFDPDRELRQLHLGGGTPTFLDDRQMWRLMESIDGQFTLAPKREREFSVEVDPRAVGDDTLALLGGLGFDRISVGVQDFDPKVQQAVNRVQSFGLTERVINLARRAGFNELSIDLIYGLPHQTRETFARTLEQVLQLHPDRLSVYSYAHLPNRVKAQKLIDGFALPSPEEKLGIMEDTLETLAARGYRAIGMDHFALPDSELCKAMDAGTLQRNFQGYSTHADCDLVGVGVSAIGQIGDGYCQNESRLPRYYAAVDAGRLPMARGYELTDEDRLRAAVIEQAMCRDRIDFSDIAYRFHVDFRSHFAPELEALKPMEVDGLLRVTPDSVELQGPGRLLRRNIAAVFDAYLNGNDEPVVKYSRSI